MPENKHGFDPFAFLKRKMAEAARRKREKRGIKLLAVLSDYAPENKGIERTALRLIRRGADPGLKKDSWSALHYASFRGYATIVRTLLEHRAQPDVRDNDNSTPLHMAALYGHTESVRALVDHGADANIKRKNGQTALMHAANNGYDAIIDLLLDHGAHIDAKDNDGRTALMYATGWGYSDSAKLLLARGANPLCTDNDNKSAASRAQPWHEGNLQAVMKDIAAAQIIRTPKNTPALPRIKIKPR